MVEYRQMLRPIATDTHDFPSLRRDGCIYVDKTMFIHRLATDPNTKLFFISRPLFNANSLFGLSRNTIAAHFQHEYENANGYSFSWMIKFCDINNPDDYPTIESALQDVQIRDKCIDMKPKPRRLVDCATERVFEKTDLESVQSLQEKNHAVCNA